MTMNTNRHARALRKALVPKQYTSSPWQWGYVVAVHAPAQTTLSASAAAGAQVFTTAASIAANSLIQVGTGGPVLVESVSGTGPYTITTVRGIPFAAANGATVRTIATVDLYLDGWQNPPDNLPTGVTKTITPGVRYLGQYTPIVGHVCLVARGTGLGRSDRVALGIPSVGQPAMCKVYRNGTWTLTGGNVSTVVPYDTVVSDTAGGYSTGTGLYTVKQPGDYLVTGGFQTGYGGTSGGFYLAQIYHNGAQVKNGPTVAATGFVLIAVATDIVTCVVGDTLAVNYNVQTGGSGDTGIAITSMAIRRLP